eukprot:gene14290-10213_t
MESGGDKPKKEETLLIEELLSPRAFEQWKRGELDMFSNIPVRTWATGSPLKEGDDGSERKERHYDPEDLVDYSQGMDAYFAKSVGQIEEGQGDEEEEGDEDDDALINEMENYLAEDNDDNDEQGYSTQFHEVSGSPVKNHAVDFVVEAGNDSEEENSYEDDYEAASLEQSHKKGGYNGLFDLNANATADDDEDDEEDGGEESDAEESAEDDGEEYEEGDEDDDDEERMGIENDYNDLLAYMNSPREGDTHAIQPKKVVSTMFLPGQGKGPMVAALSRPPQAPKPDNGRSIAAVKGAKQPSRDRPRGQKKKVNGSSSSSKKHNNKPQKGKKKGAAANKAAANGNEAMRRHKDMLAAMANKRKQEEEEIAVMAEQEKERRRKFKEALLEKAIRSKKAQEEALAALSADKIPSFLHPTHAYKAQSVTKKTADQVNMTEEEILLQDQQKREYIAQIRRKFKEQHKKTLMALVAKKREEEAKHEQLKVEEDQLKEKRRQKLMKMLAEKEASILNYQTRAESPAAEAVTADDHHHHHHYTPAAAAAATFKTEVKATEKARAPKRRPSMDGKLPVSTPPSAAAGSGLAAIRSRQGGAGDEGGEPVATKTSAAKAAAAAAKDKTPPPALAPVAAEQKAKLSEYLQTLAEQKKREEKEKLKLEERKKRRVALLRERILQEAAERKLMQMEDDPKYQVAAATTNNDADNDKAKKKKKITPEMAEAMAQRLAGNKANTTAAAAAAAAAQPTLVPKPPAGPKKVATGGGPVTSTSAPSTAAPTKEKKDRDRDRDRDEKPPSKPSSKLRESVSVDAADENQPSNSLLAATSSTAVSTVPARDFNDWKRKNHVPSDGKVFCMTGWYPCVKQALLDRGWHFNPDPASPYFHLKWTLRSLDVNHETLQPWQLINHFMKNVAITTKCGLIKSLQSLKWMDDVDCSDIIPRAYDLSVQNDIQGVLDDFRSQLAENLLKKLYLKLTGVERLQGPGPGPEASSGQEESDNDDGDGDVRPEQSTSTVDATGGGGGVSGGAEPKDNVAEVLQAMSNDPVIPPVPPVLDDRVFDAADSSTTAAHAMINPAVFDAACRILETLLKPYEDAYLDDDSPLNGAFAGDLDWEIIENYDLHTAYPQGLPTVAPEPIDNFVSNMFNSPDGDGGVDTSVELRLSHALRREKKKHARWLEEQRQQAHERIKQCRRITRHDLERIHTLLYRLVGYHGPQYCLNGTGSVAQNMWIVKPASKSRGRGIMTFNDLPKLLKYVQLSNTVAGSGSSQWVVQKYLENPLIIANRKFDMRQWVLVYDWNPLTIYFFDEFYARFSVEEYSVDNTDMDNVYVHLVNNSIGKNSEHFHKVVTAENGVAIEGYMWSFQDFSAYIAGRHGGGRDIVKEKIQPRMKDIAKWALMCGSEAIEHRKNSWELYGFDFMVDDDYNAWLIEINSSPACDYSTKVTERYVQKALVEILDIVLDVRDWEQQPKKTRGPGPSTGSWECIYRGPAVELPVGSFGTEMTLKGEGYKGLKRAYVPPAPVAAASSASSSSGATAAGGGGGGGLLSVGSSESLAPTTVSLKPMANAAATATSRKAAQPSPVYRSQSTVHGNNGGSGSGSSGNNQSAAAAVGTRHSSAPSGSHNGGAGPTGKKDVAAAAYDESDDAFNDSDDEGSLTRHVPSPAQATTTTTSTAMQATASSKANMHKARRTSVGLTAPATATAASNNGGVGAIPVPVKTFTLEL